MHGLRDSGPEVAGEGPAGGWAARSIVHICYEALRAILFPHPELGGKLAELRSLRPEKGAYGGEVWANYAATYFNDCARFCEVTARVMAAAGLVVVVIGNNILQEVEFKTDEFFAHIAELYGFEIQELHRVRKKRTGSSIIHSSVRVGSAKGKTELYEDAIEPRISSALKRPRAQQ
jgi:hypothetical protein